MVRPSPQPHQWTLINHACLSVHQAGLSLSHPHLSLKQTAYRANSSCTSQTCGCMDRHSCTFFSVDVSWLQDVDGVGEGSGDAPQQNAERGIHREGLTHYLQMVERSPHRFATMFAPAHYSMLRCKARSSPSAVACPKARSL